MQTFKRKDDALCFSCYNIAADGTGALLPKAWESYHSDVLLRWAEVPVLSEQQSDSDQ